ncbi:hypothetical protein BDQ17DRAFT_1441628 [Cyathus striatus]|nr:hypothetical protein BDQ17DRAFT_1441628 [Cyathus striatus]
MSDIIISPKDMAQCQEIAAKTATAAAVQAMAEAISEVKAKVVAQHAEAEEAEAAKQAEEEMQAEEERWVEEERWAEAEVKVLCLKAEADALAALLLPKNESLMSPLAGLVSSFTALDTSTAPPSPAMEEEDELLEDNVSPQLDLSTVAARKQKAAPKPITTFAPASKHRKIPGGVDITVPLEQIIPLPEHDEPKPASTSGYHLRDCSITSATASTLPSHPSTKVATRAPAKASTSKSSKTSKASSKAMGTKAVKHTHKEMPQLTLDEPINIELLQNNLQELIKHFGAHVCINCISHSRPCEFWGFDVKCGTCSQVSASHCSFSIPPPNTEFALSVAHCAGDSSLFGLNEACRALNLSRTRAYHALLAAELEQVEYAQNCIAVVRHLQDIAFLHSPDHLHAVEGLSPDFTRNTLLPNPSAIFALKKALECSFALHTFNLCVTSSSEITGFPNAKETVAIKDFAKSLKPRNLEKLGGVFGNSQLYPLSLEDYSGATPGPSGSSSVRAIREGNTEHSVDLGKED